jgi:protein O-mannosyl-transferase
MVKTVRRPKGAKPVIREPRASSTRSKVAEAPAISAGVLWVSLALIAVNLIVYSPVWHYGFLTYDDPLYVSDNIEVARGLSWSNVLWAFTTNHAASWHPLTWLSHMLDVQLYGMNAGCHHLTNLLLHIASTLLLFWWFCRTTGTWKPGALVAGLFAVHPLHVESVAWIAERKDVLSTLFFMLALHAYVSYVRRPQFRRYLAVLGLFAFGLMSKSMVVTLPFVLLLLDVWPLSRVRLEPGPLYVWRKLILEKIPLVAVAVCSAAITFMVQLKGGTVQQLDSFPLGLRAANALLSYGLYTIKMLWPTNLAAFYPFEPLSGWWVAGSVLGLLAISVCAVLLARRHPEFLIGWLWYLTTLVPVIGLIQVGGKSRADRFTYVPLTGIFIILAWGIPRLVSRWRYRDLVLQTATGILFCLLIITARNQVYFWGSDLSLWEHTTPIANSSYFAHHNLGIALINEGDIKGGISEYAEALRIDPTSAETHNALGDVLSKAGRLDEALKECKEAVRYKPGFAEAHSNLGTILARQGKLDAAIPELREASRLEPQNAGILYNLGFALADRGRFEEAIVQFHEALKFNPSYAEAHNRLGNVFLIQGKTDDAIAQYTEALQNNPEFVEAHNNLGVALRNQHRDGDAIAHFEEALRINPGFMEAHNNLGLALLDQNQAEKAVEHFSEALRIAPGRPDVISNLGIALSECNRDSEAIACFTEVLRLNPADAKARQYLSAVLAHQRKSARSTAAG